MHFQAPPSSKATHAISTTWCRVKLAGARKAITAPHTILVTQHLCVRACVCVCVHMWLQLCRMCACVCVCAVCCVRVRECVTLAGACRAITARHASLVTKRLCVRARVCVGVRGYICAECVCVWYVQCVRVRGWCVCEVWVCACVCHVCVCVPARVCVCVCVSIPPTTPAHGRQLKQYILSTQFQLSDNISHLAPVNRFLSTHCSRLSTGGLHVIDCLIVMPEPTTCAA